MTHPLRQYRDKRGLTLRQLAKILGVSHSVVYKWEKGDRQPSPEMTKKVAEITRIAKVRLRPDIYG